VSASQSYSEITRQADVRHSCYEAVAVAVEWLLLTICVREFTCLKLNEMPASPNLIFCDSAHVLQTNSLMFSNYRRCQY